MVVYRRERERERAVVSAFENLKIKEKERERLSSFTSREKTPDAREKERERFPFVSSLRQRKKTIMITWSNNSAAFAVRQNASINLLASSHRRSDVTSYATFGKYTCQSRGGRELSRGVLRD